MNMNFEKYLYGLPLLLAAMIAAGCGGGEQAGEGMAEGEGEGGEEMAMPVVDAATAATIGGTVMFEGTPPEPRAIDMSEEAACAEKYTEPPMTQNVVVNEDGTLANVFVYVKEGLGDMSFPTPREPVVLDQAGCRYTPHVFGIQVGQTLLIKNSDGVLHNINAKPNVNRGFNISQPVVMETKRSFSQPEVMVPLECDVHGWMNAYGGVLEHPYYSVTDGGSFQLAPLPPGTYTIEAWHEEYGTQTQQVTVEESGTAEITFTFSAPSA